MFHCLIMHLKKPQYDKNKSCLCYLCWHLDCTTGRNLHCTYKKKVILQRPTTSNTTLLWKRRYFTAQTWQHAPAYRDLKSREIFPFLPVIDWLLRWEHGIDWHSDKGVIFPITGSKRLSAHPISSGTIRYCPWLHLASQEAALFMTACSPHPIRLTPPTPANQPSLFTASLSASKEHWRLWQIWGF